MLSGSALVGHRHIYIKKNWFSNIHFSCSKTLLATPAKLSERSIKKPNRKKKITFSAYFKECERERERKLLSSLRLRSFGRTQPYMEWSGTTTSLELLSCGWQGRQPPAGCQDITDDDRKTPLIRSSLHRKTMKAKLENKEFLLWVSATSLAFVCLLLSSESLLTRLCYDYMAYCCHTSFLGPLSQSFLHLLTLSDSSSAHYPFLSNGNSIS